MKYVDWTSAYPSYWWTRTTSTSNGYDDYKRWVAKNIEIPSPPKRKPEKFLSDDLDRILEVKSE